MRRTAGERSGSFSGTLRSDSGTFVPLCSVFAGIGVTSHRLETPVSWAFSSARGGPEKWDHESYKLKLEQARAAQAGAQATLKQTEAEYERQAELASRQVASKQALDNATANRDSARARLKQAEVDTAQAELNLGYTELKAPFDGIVTARQVSLGELVGANGPTQLATIVQTAPV